MKQESLKHLADGATISAVSTGAGNYLGWFGFINENAPGIGVLLSMFFGICGVVFYVISYRKATVADDNAKKIDQLAEMIQRLSKEGKDDS